MPTISERYQKLSQKMELLQTVNQSFLNGVTRDSRYMSRF